MHTVFPPKWRRINSIFPQPMTTVKYRFFQRCWRREGGSPRPPANNTSRRGLSKTLLLSCRWTMEEDRFPGERSTPPLLHTTAYRQTGHTSQFPLLLRKTQSSSPTSSSASCIKWFQNSLKKIWCFLYLWTVRREEFCAELAGEELTEQWQQFALHILQEKKEVPLMFS
jgi:hypothetical protein